MKKISRRSFIKTTAGMAAFGALSACASTSSSESTQQESGQQDSEAPTQSSNFNAEGLPILKEKETFTIAVKQTSSLKAAAERKPVIEAAEKTNVEIEWIEIPPSAWVEKINIMFNTDSLPDAIIGDVDVAKYYELLAPMSTAIDKYAPSIKEFLSRRDDYSKGLVAPDGEIHSLPTGDESTHNLIDTHTWVNSLWLENLDMEMPTTTDEFREMLVAFKEKDPNKSGDNDEMGYTFQAPWGHADTIENMFGAFGVVENDNHVFVKDGTVVFSALEDGYYNALSWMHSLYADGLIDSNVFTLSTEQYRSQTGGKDVLGAFASYGGNNMGAPNDEDEMRYVPMPSLKGPDGTQMVGVNNVATAKCFVISKKCKNPDALVRWYDYINSSLRLALEWGRGGDGEGFWWNIVEDENGKEIPQFLTVSAEQLKERGYNTKAEYRSAESFAGETPSLWRYEYDVELIYDDAWPTDQKLIAIQRDLPIAVNGLPLGIGSQENADRRVILKTDIDTYLKKFIADSIINGVDEDKWAQHLDDMVKLKAGEYLELCQEFVDELNNQ